MKKNQSILVLGILSISLLIVLSIIQSSTAQRYEHPRYDQRYPYYDRYYDYDDYTDSNSEYYYYEDLDLAVRVPW